MSEWSSSLVAVFRSATQQAGTRDAVADSLDFLEAVRSTPDCGAYRVLQEAGLLGAVLPAREDEGDGGICSKALYAALERGTLLATDQPLRQTGHILAGLLLGSRGAAGSWLRDSGLKVEDCLSREDTFLPPPAPKSRLSLALDHVGLVLCVLVIGLSTDLAAGTVVLPLACLVVLHTLICGAHGWIRQSLTLSRCARCQRESTIRSMFDWDTGLCRPCLRDLDRRPTREYGLAFGALATLALLCLPLWPHAAYFLGNLALLLPLDLLSIVLHESGHAAAGWLLGYRVISLHVGHGAVWASGRVGSRWWYLHRKLSGGLTMGLSRFSRFKRLRAILYSAGGPAVNLALFALCWRGGEIQNLVREWSAGLAPWLTFGYLNLAKAVMNFTPRDVKAGAGVTIPSDGKRMWLIATQRREASIALLQQLDLLAVQVYREVDNPEAQIELLRFSRRPGVENELLVGLEMALLTRLERHEEALALMDELPSLDSAEGPERRGNLLNCMAWTCLKAGQVNRAGELIDEALSLFPGCTSLRETAGEVRMAQGRILEAEELLQSCVEQAFRLETAVEALPCLARIAALRGDASAYAERRQLLLLLQGETDLAASCAEEARSAEAETQPLAGVS